MKAEEKAMELYPVKNQHVPTIGGRTAYVDVNEKARKAFLKGYEYANQQPEFENFKEHAESAKHEQLISSEQVDELIFEKQPEQGEVDKVKQLQELAIWMTGCGYDFTQHDYYLQNTNLIFMNMAIPKKKYSHDIHIQNILSRMSSYQKSMLLKFLKSLVD